ncbi:zinc finger, CCHC-type, retrotransposon gag domain protein [Tanacetum coccineum]
MVSELPDGEHSLIYPEFSGPTFDEAVQRAVNALLPGLTTQITNELRQNGAGSSVDAENWIAYIEKLFEVLGCADEFKARLASYKFEGDALNWWKAFKQAKGGEAYMAALSWKDFREILFLQYFPRSEQQKYEKEYHMIRQRDGEPSGEFMERFLRLVGFLGKKAGTQEELTKNFKWALCDWILDGIVNTEFSDVAHVANAARNIEILRKRTSQNNKRNRDGDRIRSTTQGSSQIGYDQKRHDGRGYDRHGSSQKEYDQKGYDDRSYDRQGGNNNQRSWRDRDQQNRGRQYNRSSGSSGQKGYSDYASSPPCKICGKLHLAGHVIGLLELASLVVRLGIWLGVVLRMAETVVREVGTTSKLLQKGVILIQLLIVRLVLQGAYGCILDGEHSLIYPEFSGPTFDEAVQRAVNALLPGLTTQITNELVRMVQEAVLNNPRLSSTWKQAKGGEAYMAALSWKDFREILFLQYFPRSRAQSNVKGISYDSSEDGETQTKRGNYDKRPRPTNTRHPVAGGPYSIPTTPGYQSKGYDHKTARRRMFRIARTDQTNMISKCKDDRSMTAAGWQQTPGSKGEYRDQQNEVGSTTNRFFWVLQVQKDIRTNACFSSPCKDMWKTTLQDMPKMLLELLLLCSTGHMARGCPKNGRNGGEGSGDDKQAVTKGRNFDSTTNRAASASV